MVPTLHLPSGVHVFHDRLFALQLDAEQGEEGFRFLLVNFDSGVLVEITLEASG